MCTAKERSLKFAFKHKPVVEETKMLIKYKCKIMHYLFEYISKIVLDDNEKLLINEIAAVLIGAGTFTSISSFNKQSLQLVTMNKLKDSKPGGLQLFPFYL